MVKAPEDTILRKMLWFREGGEVSDRQWRDILGVLRGATGQPEPGLPARLGRSALALTDLLDRATAEVGA